MAQGQFLSELGPRGEVGGELLAERHRPAISVFTVLGTAQNLVHAPHPRVGSRLPRPFLFGGGPFLGDLGVILDHLVQEVLLLRRSSFSRVSWSMAVSDVTVSMAWRARSLRRRSRSRAACSAWLRSASSLR